MHRTSHERTPAPHTGLFLRHPARIQKKEIPVKTQPSVTFNGIRRLHDQDKRFGFSASVSCTRGNARSSVQSRSDYFLEKLVEQPCSPRSFPWKPSSRVSAAFLFFFQAEDGIRDLTVTGVQTCALPICFRPDASFPARLTDLLHTRFVRLPDGPPVFVIPTELLDDNGPRVAAMVDRLADEIGRASCRERV